MNNPLKRVSAMTTNNRLRNIGACVVEGLESIECCIFYLRTSVPKTDSENF
jgi:hypothetical protein